MAVAGFLLMQNLGQKASVKLVVNHVFISRKFLPVLSEEWLPVTDLQPETEMDVKPLMTRELQSSQLLYVLNGIGITSRGLSTGFM